jgi:5-formyltetrahydrofolate cyclo-ligase
MVAQLPPAKHKEQLRAAVLEHRGELDSDTIRRASELMCERLAADPVFEQAACIGGYSAIRGEIDPRALLKGALERGRVVCLPRVVDQHHIEFCEVSDFAKLREGAFGVMEPQGPAIELGRIDVFLVPGVAFDERGGRIGFGRGYYDRLLGRRRQLDDAPTAIFVGICYDWQLVDDAIAVEPHDVAMDLVATDNGIIRCG